MIASVTTPVVEGDSVTSKGSDASTCGLDSVSLVPRGVPFTRHMSTTIECRIPLSLPLSRWAGLLTLLVGEFLILTVRFDGDRVAVDRALYVVAIHSGSLTRLASAVGLATLLVASLGWFRILTLEVGRLKTSSGFVPLVVLNLLSFVSFYGLSVASLEGGGASVGMGVDRCLVRGWLGDDCICRSGCHSN